MSRYQILGRNPAHEVIVGWDPAIKSYFGQVFDPGLDQEYNPVYTVGYQPGQIADLADLARLMERFADIDTEMLVMLTGDRIIGR